MNIEFVVKMLNLGQTFPDFTAETTIGSINLYEYLGDSWGLLLSHPSDFTPVCTTEISRVSQLAPEFNKRNVKVLIISVDSVEDHINWSKDIEQYCGCKLPFPVCISRLTVIGLTRLTVALILNN